MKDKIKMKIMQMVGFSYLYSDVDTVQLEITEDAVNIKYYDNNFKLQPIILQPIMDIETDTSGFKHIDQLNTKALLNSYDSLGIKILTDYYYDIYNSVVNKNNNERNNKN